MATAACHTPRAALDRSATIQRSRLLQDSTTSQAAMAVEASSSNLPAMYSVNHILWPIRCLGRLRPHLGPSLLLRFQRYQHQPHRLHTLSKQLELQTPPPTASSWSHLPSQGPIQMNLPNTQQAARAMLAASVKEQKILKVHAARRSETGLFSAVRRASPGRWVYATCTIVSCSFPC